MISSSFLNAIKARPISAASGVVIGVAFAIAWVNWAVNLAPFDDEASSAWSAPGQPSEDTRTATAIYQPRFDELLRRVRVNGRFGGLAWENLREATDAWLLADPIACLNHLIASGATGLIDDSLLDQAIERAAPGNFALALRLAEEIGSASIRSRWITRAYGQHAKSEPESALMALESLPPQMRHLAFALAHEWAKQDPKKAFDAFLRQQPTFAGFAASSWAEHDPEGAFAFFANAPRTIRTETGQSVSSQVMLNSVVMRIINEDPAKVIQMISQLPKNARRTGDLRRAFHMLAEKEPQRALDLAKSLPGDLERFQAQAAIASSVIRNDPTLAAQIRESLPGERIKSSAEAGSVWGSGLDRFEKPAAAAERVGSITNPIARSDALHSVATVWLHKKQGEFAEFATQQVNSGDRTWIRAMADTLVDWAEHSPERTPHVFELTSRLGEEALAQLRQEISAQTSGASRERLLERLKK